MIAETTVWSILQGHMPRKRWVSSKDIYAIVEQYGDLKEEDLQPRSPRCRTPQWKTLVRNVLMNRWKNGKLRWRKGSNRQESGSR
ncbi:MAG TPA: hypothetical protein VGR15_08180 [Bacteroidota bacterium]|nr:hypothetical protein [Bacteroidota bacterium]